jgi:hypothetical protein
MSLATQTLPSIEEAKEVMTMAQIYPRRRARVPGLDLSQLPSQTGATHGAYDARCPIDRP